MKERGTKKKEIRREEGNEKESEKPNREKKIMEWFGEVKKEEIRRI